MLRFICLILLIGISTQTGCADEVQLSKQKDFSKRENIGWQEVWGETTNGLQPYINFSPSTAGWDVIVSCLARVDFPERAWLKTTNRVGSKLELWQTNGVRLISKSPDVLAAFHLPKQTTVSEIVFGGYYPRNKRGYQWWELGESVQAEHGGETARFSLQSAFEISLTNDYVFRIVPLIYKVDTNLVDAHLVEFPALKIKLKSNGAVEKME